MCKEVRLVIQNSTSQEHANHEETIIGRSCVLKAYPHKEHHSKGRLQKRMGGRHGNEGTQEQELS